MPHSQMYEFAIAQAKNLAGTDKPLVLDFGCGAGGMVECGLSQGLEMVGADTFEGWFQNWQDMIAPHLAERISRIEGALPFPDGHFDVVVANQVFEHVKRPAELLPEIRRVLKPGGAFLAMFPVQETWFEPHVRLYFAHRVGRGRLFRFYLKAARLLGLGDHPAGTEWADRLDKQCAYHRTADVRRWWQEAFGSEPQFIDADVAAFRLPVLAGRIPKPFLSLIARARIGVAVVARRPRAI